MTTPNEAVEPAPPSWAKPNDPGGYLAHQLLLVATGRKHRAAGIRHCTDCGEAFIDDHTGLTWCPTCRPAHRHRCVDCGAPFPNTPGGDRRCTCCRAQLALFTTDTDTDGGSTS